MYVRSNAMGVCIYSIESVKAEQLVVTRSLTLEGNGCMYVCMHAPMLMMYVYMLQCSNTVGVCMYVRSYATDVCMYAPMLWVYVFTALRVKKPNK